MSIPTDDTQENQGVFAQPALWLPQSVPWALAGLCAVADALLQAGCRVRIYDADFAGGNPLARSLTPAALGGTWTVLATSHHLPWWEVPLNAVARGEHAVLWIGMDNQPPEGWSALASRARARELDTYWLPGDSAAGLPRLASDIPELKIPEPTRWLALRTWSRSPKLRSRVEADWKAGYPPRVQIGRRMLWLDQAHAAYANRKFSEDLGGALIEV